MAFVPSNIKRFNYQSTNAHNFSALCNLSGAEGYVLYSPLQQNIYSWVIPEGGIPKEEDCCWSTFKTINETTSGPITLWDRGFRGGRGCPKAFEDMVHNHYPCYLIPMKELMYTFWYVGPEDMRVVGERELKHNFYINHEEKHYSIMPQGDEMTCSIVDTVNLNLYNLYDNTTVPGKHHGYDDLWQNISGWHSTGWDLPPSEEQLTLERRPQTPLSQTPLSQTPPEPMTPPPPAARRNLMDEFEDDINLDQIDTESESESSEEESSESDSEDEVATIVDGIPVSDEEDSDDDPEYEPSSEEEEEDEEEETRMDDSDGGWYTKSQFYEWYGCWAVWRAMDPRKLLKRRALTCSYELGAKLPCDLRHKFISEFLETY